MMDNWISGSNNRTEPTIFDSSIVWRFQKNNKWGFFDGILNPRFFMKSAKISTKLI